MNEAAIFAATAFGVTAMLCLTFLRAWRDWLELRRHELDRSAMPSEAAGVRIELAGVKERLRKIEAIADGVEP